MRPEPPPPPSVPAIIGVATSSCAFIGRTTAGPADEAVSCSSFAEVMATFGAAAPGSELFASVRLFFENGGRECRVVRVASGPGTPAPADFIGDAQGGRGLHALPRASAIGMLVVPRDAALDAAAHVQVLAAASRFCAERRAFLLADAPRTWALEGHPAVTDADVASLREALAAEEAAVYFPDLRQGETGPFVGAAGAAAGIAARTDRARGVWHSPAGREARLAGDPELAVHLGTLDGDRLNRAGVNALRRFNGETLVWGSRTLAGFDGGSEWKYVAVRRLGLFIQRSLEDGLQWARSEPSGEALWAQVRRAAGDFLHGLYAAGAFVGRSAKEAYVVKCDASTMTAAETQSGTVVLLVGFAPLRPAEFMILRIELRAAPPISAALAAAADALRAGRAVPAAQRRRRTRRSDTVLLVGGHANRRSVAEAVAARLDRSLQEVDLAAVVSKYLGETEKRLDELFVDAEGAGHLLFFDEADALFGARTEVEDAHDRYANLELASLLDRIRACDGVAMVGVSPGAPLSPAVRARARCVVRID